MNRLNKAIELAIEVHADQTDLGGHPYILHPLRVLCAVEEIIREMKVEDRESVLCSAVLHDCIEDSKNQEYIANAIEVRFGNTVLKTVDSLTRRKNESWKNYINRVNEHWAPRIIKIADLHDNSDLSRLKELTDKDEQRNKMYSKALTILLTPKGKNNADRI